MLLIVQFTCKSFEKTLRLKKRAETVKTNIYVSIVFVKRNIKLAKLKHVTEKNIYRAIVENQY